MRLKIVQAGDPVLRRVGATLTREQILSEEIQRLIHDMQDTMRDAPGVGLAAPQIGLSMQLAVIEDAEAYLKNISAEDLEKRGRKPVAFHVLINPRIVEFGEEPAEFYEGCLSLSGFSAIVSRSLGVRVEYLDENAVPHRVEASGWYARILQHEIDHLNGNLYIDRVNTRTFTTMENWGRYGKSLGK